VIVHRSLTRRAHFNIRYFDLQHNGLHCVVLTVAVLNESPVFTGIACYTGRTSASHCRIRTRFQ